ncbi:MAG: error-prone DNA polymerase [Candidatus Eisenbacteria bacterium]
MCPAGLPAYIPLWCKSNYSFLEGASHPEELVEEAQRLGVRSLAITDRDGVYGLARGHMRAAELGFHLILGSQITVDDGSHLLLLAQDREGYASLCGLISAGRLRCEKGRSEVSWTEICSRSRGLIALWGGQGSLLQADADPLFVARDLTDAFGDRLYALVTRHRRADEPVIEARTRERAARYGLPIVAGNEVLYHTPSRRCLQDALTCIRHGVTLATAGTRTKPNAEHVLKSPHGFALLFEDDLSAVARTQEVAARCTFRLDEIRYRYPGEKLPDGTTSQEWLRHLTWEGARERYLPDVSSGEEEVACGVYDDAIAVARGVDDASRDDASDDGDVDARLDPGLGARIVPLPQRPPLTLQPPKGIPDDVVMQVERELSLVEELDYDGYFLTMWEIVQFCRREGILCQGRGSAANSAVCFCLGITAIDPVRMGLLFERFLSRERAEPPDIDLDIEHDRREEVIQWVYRKYGRSHAAMVANFIRFRTRSAVREIGKVLGFAETEVDRLAKLLPNYGGITTDSIRQVGLDVGNPMHQQLLALVLEVQDFPRHLSIHPGGFLLGHEPIDRLVPIENGAMDARTVIQWDKEDIENLGLFKIDLLGLGALRQLHLAFDLIRAHYGRLLSMATIPADDDRTYEMIRRADTVGVFQIESRAQMAMLPRLRPNNYYDLVIEVSIVRPGPIAGGMVHPYLRRRNGEEEVTYPHACLEPVLKKTLGVPLFQEQVMKLAVVAADYTPGEADRLRRDMAAWRSTGRIDRHRELLVTRMKKKGIEEEFALRVFDQIRGFGEYGFPESHAASFALIAYATAWVRTHYIDAFTCALLNAYPMGFYSPATIIEDARRHGVTVLPPDVAVSGWECSLEPIPRDPSASGSSIGVVPVANPSADGAMSGPASDIDAPVPSRDGVVSLLPKSAVRLGLRYVKGLGERERQAFEAARAERCFLSIEDFAQRTRLEGKALCRLAEAGAFGSFEPERRQALWKVRALHPTLGEEFEVDTGRGRSGLVAASERGNGRTPRFRPLTGLEEIAWDYETSSLSTRGHPLVPFRAELEAMGLPNAKTLNSGRGGARVRFAGVVLNRQRPGTAGGVTFMTLEDETGFVNLVIWQQVYEQFRLEVKTSAFLGVEGKLQVESGVVHLIADRFWIPQLTTTVQSGGSRDFH